MVQPRAGPPGKPQGEREEEGGNGSGWRFRGPEGPEEETGFKGEADTCKLHALAHTHEHVGPEMRGGCSPRKGGGQGTVRPTVTVRALQPHTGVRYVCGKMT